MEAGKLRQRVEIQRGTPVQSASGAETLTWAALATVWAAVEPLSGREFTTSHAAGAETSHRVRIRYLAGISPKDRVLFGTRVLMIESVIDVEERHREVHLMCRELTA